VGGMGTGEEALMPGPISLKLPLRCHVCGWAGTCVDCFVDRQKRAWARQATQRRRELLDLNPDAVENNPGGVSS
jgi:hypothetical protein